MKSNCILMLLSILLGSCTSQKNTIAVFPDVVKVQADSILISPELLAVTRLFVVHDTLVVYEQQKDTLFSFWTLPDCRYLFAGGLKGQGPNDFLTLDKGFVETKNGFKTFELSTNKVKELQIDNNKGIGLVAEQRLDVNRQPLNRFLFLADSSYCYLSDDEKYEYTLLDKKGRTSYFGDYPQDLLKKKEGEINSYIYNKLTVAKPDGKRFAAFYAYINMVRIYDSKGGLIKEMLMENPTTLADDGIGRKTYYISYPYAKDEFIYVINASDNEKRLEVWSWDGTPVANYQLDKDINVFTISERYNKMYAINRDVENKIFVYSLSE